MDNLAGAPSRVGIADDHNSASLPLIILLVFLAIFAYVAYNIYLAVLDISKSASDKLEVSCQKSQPRLVLDR